MISHPTNAAIVLGACIVAAMCLASPAHGLDYERNDVLGREVGIGLMRTPTNGLPMTLVVRGTARRHARHFYVDGSVFMGMTFEVQPLLMGTVSFGMESADDSFRRVRGYGEVGSGLFFANSEKPLLDLLAFHLEGGLRIHLRTWARPHTQVTVGVRLLSNFRFVGLMGMVGTNFTFD